MCIIKALQQFVCISELSGWRYWNYPKRFYRHKKQLQNQMVRFSINEHFALAWIECDLKKKRSLYFLPEYQISYTMKFSRRSLTRHENKTWHYARKLYVLSSLTLTVKSRCQTSRTLCLARAWKIIHKKKAPLGFSFSPAEQTYLHIDIFSTALLVKH